MTWENGAMIEKPDGKLVFKHEPGSKLATYDLAKEAGRLTHRC